MTCKCGRNIWTFNDARKHLPKCLGGFDPLGHTTLQDLLFLAETELDFYFERQDGCDITTTRQLHQVQSFVSTVKHAIEGGC